jgi:uncharacterized protein
MLPPEPKQLDKLLDRNTVLTLTIAIEAFLLLCATLWMVFEKLDIRPMLYLSKRTVIIGLLAGNLVSLANLAILWAGRRWSQRSFLLRSMRDLVTLEMVPIFGRLKFIDRFFIALISGFCEEIFFRGVLEKSCGMASSAFCFGLAHFPSLYYFPYAIWATLIGLLMSLLSQICGSLWCPIIAHAMINLISLNVIANLDKEPK